MDNHIDEEGLFDDEPCWLFEPVTSVFFENMKTILPKRKSWSNNIVLFGKEDSNNIEVLKNKNNQVIR